MIDQFNRINNALGANRMKLEFASSSVLDFIIENWGRFTLFSDGRISEWLKGDYGAGGYVQTPNSRWLHAISLGKKRDEEGRVG